MAAWWEKQNFDEETKSILRARQKETNKKKWGLIISILFIIVLTIVLYKVKYLSKDTFELLFTAFIGGFIGSALSYIVKGEY